MTTADEKQFLNSLSLEAASARSPLRHFKGRLAAIGHKEVASNFTDGGQRNQLQLTLQFDGVDVYEATTEYRWKTAELVFTHRSQVWGILGTSLTRQLGPGTMLGDSIGKVMTLKVTPGHPTRQRTAAGVWEETKIEAFEVISIDGVSGTSAAIQVESMDTILVGLADGATAEVFEARIYQDSRVKGNTTLLAQLSQVGVVPILTRLEQEGLIAKDGSGVYHKAPSPAPEA